MLKRRFPEPEASGGSAKRARQLDRDRESLQQQGHRVARSQVEGIPRAWRLQVIDRESLVEPGTQIARGGGKGRRTPPIQVSEPPERGLWLGLFLLGPLQLMR